MFNFSTKLNYWLLNFNFKNSTRGEQSKFNEWNEQNKQKGTKQMVEWINSVELFSNKTFEVIKSKRNCSKIKSVEKFNF